MDPDLEAALLALRDALPACFAVERHRLPNCRWIAWARRVIEPKRACAGFGETEADAIRHLVARLQADTPKSDEEPGGRRSR